MHRKMTRPLLAGAALALWTLGGTLSAQESPASGSIRGAVRYKGQAPAPRKVKADKDMAVCGQHPIYAEELIVSKKGGLENVVVRVSGAKGEAGAGKAATRASITQKGCRFIPHVQVIQAGVRMNIFNQDGIAHNIHTLSVDNPSFNQQQPGARKRMVTKKGDFTLPEIIPVKCDIHGWMKAWIVVADNPYHAVSDAEGSFEIPGIPAGTYTVEFWHEILGKKTRRLRVEPGAATEVELVFEPGK